MQDNPGGYNKYKIALTNAIKGVNFRDSTAYIGDTGRTRKVKILAL